MSVWTMDQVAQVRGLRSRAWVDVYVDDGDERVGFTKGEMARTMTLMAHAFAVEVCPGDCRFKQRDVDDYSGRIEILGWWEPQTKEIELRGGHRDGDHIEYRDAPHRPLMVPAQFPGTAMLDPMDTEPWAMDIRQPLLYECTGWHESERHWIYDPVPS